MVYLRTFYTNDKPVCYCIDYAFYRFDKKPIWLGNDKRKNKSCDSKCRTVRKKLVKTPAMASVSAGSQSGPSSVGPGGGVGGNVRGSARNLTAPGAPGQRYCSTVMWAIGEQWELKKF